MIMTYVALSYMTTMIHLGWHDPLICNHYTTPVGLNLGWHGTVLCGHNDTLVGIKLGCYDAILNGHTAIWNKP